MCYIYILHLSICVDTSHIAQLALISWAVHIQNNLWLDVHHLTGTLLPWLISCPGNVQSVSKRDVEHSLIAFKKMTSK